MRPRDIYAEPRAQIIATKEPRCAAGALMNGTPHQGDWVDQSDGERIKVTASTIEFGSRFKEKIISIKPGDESGEKVLVKYGGVPPALPVELVWWLTKVNGRETLIAVNAEEPTAIFVYQRK
jgi:hypothetical protein